MEVLALIVAPFVRGCSETGPSSLFHIRSYQTIQSNESCIACGKCVRIVRLATKW